MLIGFDLSDMIVQVFIGGVHDKFDFFFIGSVYGNFVFFFSLLFWIDYLLALLLPEDQVLLKQLAQLFTLITQ